MEGVAQTANNIDSESDNEELTHINDFVMEDQPATLKAEDQDGRWEAAYRGRKLWAGGTSDEALMDAMRAGSVRSAGVQEKPDADVWLVTTGKPSHAEVKQQLDKLKRESRKGTEAQASVKMAREKARVMKAGRAAIIDCSGLDYSSLVGDGKASPEWRKKILEGARVPPPFLEGGAVGVNPAFSLSAVREFLSLVEDGCVEAEGTWRPEEMAIGDEPRARADSPLLCPAEQVAKKVRVFFEGMRPGAAGDSPTPDWVDKLVDGGAEAGVEFWE